MNKTEMLEYVAKIVKMFNGRIHGDYILHGHTAIDIEFDCAKVAFGALDLFTTELDEFDRNVLGMVNFYGHVHTPEERMSLSDPALITIISTTL